MILKPGTAVSEPPYGSKHTTMGAIDLWEVSDLWKIRKIISRRYFWLREQRSQKQLPQKLPPYYLKKIIGKSNSQKIPNFKNTKKNANIGYTYYGNHSRIEIKFHTKNMATNYPKKVMLPPELSSN